MPATRVLCVDDDPSIRMTMPLILQAHGFDAVVVGTVAEALSEIAAHPFDVLMADLNIGEQGDGYMRRDKSRHAELNRFHCIGTTSSELPSIYSLIERTPGVFPQFGSLFVRLLLQR
jgi:CheY-like chemotaxis protein